MKKNHSITTALAAITLAILSACTHTVYEPVETIRTQYRDRGIQRITTDTVSNTRLVFINGDTIIDYREKERIHTVHIHDTCLIERNDTIRVPYPVERPLSRWEQTKIDLGGIALAIATIAILMRLRRSLKLKV